MLVTRKSFIFNSRTSSRFVRRNGRKFRISMAKKEDLSDNSRTRQETIFPLKISNPILVRSVVAVLGLGFIDAGYAFSSVFFDIFVSSETWIYVSHEERFQCSGTVETGQGLEWYQRRPRTCWSLQLL